jgi:hypothetical protein
MMMLSGARLSTTPLCTKKADMCWCWRAVVVLTHAVEDIQMANSI